VSAHLQFQQWNMERLRTFFWLSWHQRLGLEFTDEQRELLALLEKQQVEIEDRIKGESK
jgi:hypothetical protein